MLDKLPDDIVCSICHYLLPYDIMNISIVNKTLTSLLSNKAKKLVSFLGSFDCRDAEFPNARLIYEN